MMTKILVIEDEAETRDIFLRCLAFEEFSAVGAKDGATGIQLANRYRPDLIVCDIMMPDMDGYGVLRSLRSQKSMLTVPFIFLTAKVTMEDLRKGMTLGADDYLTKPCTVEQFLTAISARLKRSKEMQWRGSALAEGVQQDSSQQERFQQERFQQERFQQDISQYDDASLCELSQREINVSVSKSINVPAGIFPDCPKLAPVFQFIDAHYQQSISLGDVAQAAGYSPAYLTNLAQNHTGKTIKKWITERRMAEARQRLKSTAHSIRRISEEIGYADAGYFTRQFRKLHGVTPRMWRNQLVR